jgi:hypothetical protein
MHQKIKQRQFINRHDNCVVNIKIRVEHTLNHKNKIIQKNRTENFENSFLQSLSNFLCCGDNVTQSRFFFVTLFSWFVLYFPEHFHGSMSQNFVI